MPGFGFTRALAGEISLPKTITIAAWPSPPAVGIFDVAEGANRFAEPDVVAWGQSSGFTARVEILDAAGQVVASTGDSRSGIVLASGTVDEDASQSVTRSCSLRLLLATQTNGAVHPLIPTRPGDPLDPRTGGSMVIWAGHFRPSGQPDLVKLGVFRISSVSFTSGVSGDGLNIRGYSREAAISAVPFFDAHQVAAGTRITSVIETMVVEALPNATYHIESSTVTLPACSFGDSANRMSVIGDLAGAIGMRAHFDRDDRLRVEHIAQHGSPDQLAARWAFSEGNGAVLVDIAREIDDSEMFNGVIVVGEPKNSADPPVRAVLWDTDPSSPTFYDPANPGASRVGPRPKKVVSQLISTVAQAQELCFAMLHQILSWPDQLSVTLAPNPAIEAGDVVRVVRSALGVDGLYKVQRVTHDLTGKTTKALCVSGAGEVTVGKRLGTLADVIGRTGGTIGDSPLTRVGIVTGVDTTGPIRMVDFTVDGGQVTRRGPWTGAVDLPAIGNRITYLDESPFPTVLGRMNVMGGALPRLTVEAIDVGLATAAGPGCVNEIQVVSIIGGVDAGTFTLTFDGQTSAALAFNASAQQVKEALTTPPPAGQWGPSVSNLKPADLTVDGVDGGPWTVEFIGNAGCSPQRDITVDVSLLTGIGTPGATTTVMQVGRNPVTCVNDIQHITLTDVGTGGTSGGTFTLTFDGQVSPTIPWNATAALVKTYLTLPPASSSPWVRNKSNLTMADVEVTGSWNSAWIVEFVGARGCADQPQIIVDGSLLTGLNPGISVTTAQQGYAGTYYTNGAVTPLDIAQGSITGSTFNGLSDTGWVGFDNISYGGSPWVIGAGGINEFSYRVHGGTTFIHWHYRMGTGGAVGHDMILPSEALPLGDGVFLFGMLTYWGSVSAGFGSYVPCFLHVQPATAVGPSWGATLTGFFGATSSLGSSLIVNRATIVSQAFTWVPNSSIRVEGCFRRS